VEEAQRDWFDNAVFKRKKDARLPNQTYHKVMITLRPYQTEAAKHELAP
jgi:hypothetical protein